MTKFMQPKLHILDKNEAEAWSASLHAYISFWPNLLFVPGPPLEQILPAVPEKRAGPLATSYLQLPQLPEGQWTPFIYFP